MNASPSNPLQYDCFVPPPSPTPSSPPIAVPNNAPSPVGDAVATPWLMIFRPRHVKRDNTPTPQPPNPPTPLCRGLDGSSRGPGDDTIAYKPQEKHNDGPRLVVEILRAGLTWLVRPPPTAPLGSQEGGNIGIGETAVYNGCHRRAWCAPSLPPPPPAVTSNLHVSTDRQSMPPAPCAPHSTERHELAPASENLTKTKRLARRGGGGGGDGGDGGGGRIFLGVAFC